MKESFSVEYGLKKGSTKVLWKLISTANGLSEWMADRVIAEDNVYSFTWGKGGDTSYISLKKNQQKSFGKNETD